MRTYFFILFHITYKNIHKPRLQSAEDRLFVIIDDVIKKLPRYYLCNVIILISFFQLNANMEKYHISKSVNPQKRGRFSLNLNT